MDMLSPLNRVIKKYDLNMIYIAGPGHVGPGVVANTYLEGSYSEIYPTISQDAGGMQRLFKQFSFPGGIPSHAAPETPGSIHEGGELGYAVAHVYGMAFQQVFEPGSDGAVFPILHLNGYKIANPTLLARISHEELRSLFVGYGYKPHFVEGSEPNTMHQSMAATLDTVIEEIHAIQYEARTNGSTQRPQWPLIIVQSARQVAQGQWQ